MDEMKPSEVRKVKKFCGVSCQQGCPQGILWGMTVTVASPDAQISRSVRALKAWHGCSVEDIAAALDRSKATAERRLAFGGYKFDEVLRLADYFGVTVEALSSGQLNLPASRLSSDYGCNRGFALSGEGGRSPVGVAA